MLKILIFLLISISSIHCFAQHYPSFKFVALGDMPYTIPQDFDRYKYLIAAINKSSPSFAIFVGDTKSGSTACSDEYNQKVKSTFDQFQMPLIYSIGDNEWTDCHRPLAGSYEPLERLMSLREIFFGSDKSLGKKPITLTRQADIDANYRLYVENSYWIKNQFLFVNLHIPGSNNNFERDDKSKAEYLERNKANLSWIQHAFKLANQIDIKGIIFVYQADMFYTHKEMNDIDSGYRDTLRSLSKHAEEFKRPVLLIHGDSHRLILDQPLMNIEQKYILENVLRLQVMGAEQIQAVEINVNPNAEQPFSFMPLILRKNMLHPSQ